MSAPDVKGGLAVEKRGRVWRVIAPVGADGLGLDHGPFLRKREAIAYRDAFLDRVGGDLGAVRDPDTGRLTRKLSQENRSWLFTLGLAPPLIEARRSRHGRCCEACGSHPDHRDGPCGPREGAGRYIPPEFRTWVG